MYTFRSRVRYSETDQKGYLDLNGVINYMQDCSTFESEEKNVGIAYLQECHRAWLLSGWQIVMDAYPKLGDELVIGTQAYDFKSVFGMRNFVIQGIDGTSYARANSIWVYVDTQTGRPVRVSKEEGNLYGTAEPIKMDYAPRKILIVDNLEAADPFPVLQHHLDVYHHVNNGQYVQMARDFLPQGFTVREVRVEYKEQAVLGDLVYPMTGRQGDQYLVNLCNAEGKSYATVLFLQQK